MLSVGVLTVGAGSSTVSSSGTERLGFAHFMMASVATMTENAPRKCMGFVFFFFFMGLWGSFPLQIYKKLLNRLSSAPTLLP